MNKRGFTRWISLLLIVAMVFSLLPVSALAEGVQDPDLPPVEGSTGTSSGDPAEGPGTGTGDPTTGNSGTGTGDLATGDTGTGTGDPTTGNTGTGTGDLATGDTGTGTGDPAAGDTGTGTGDPAPGDDPGGAGIFSVQPEDPQVFYATYNFYVEGVLASTQIVKNGEDLLEPEAPEKVNYRFTGWNTAANGSGTAIVFGTISGLTANVTVNAYAQYQQVYYVYFVDDANRILTTKAVQSGQRTDATEVPYVPDQGKALSHWSLTPNGIAFNFNTNITANTTLYAVVVDCCWVMFDSQGGTAVSPKYVSSGQRATAPTAPTRTGYTFAHWSLTPGGTTYNFNTPVTTDITLYAVWSAKSVNYTVVYWLEKPNVSGTPDPATNMNDYAYFSHSTKTAFAGSTVTQTAATATAPTESSIAIGTFHSSETVTVAGDGTTVLNVFFNRRLFTFTFTLVPSGVSGSASNYSMEIGGTTYYGGGTNYTFQAKFEQSLDAVWPTSPNATFANTNNNNSNKFGGWSSNSSNSGTWVTRRVTVTNDMIRSDGTTVCTGNWSSVTDKTVHYYFEALSHETGTAALTGLTGTYPAGITFVEALNYSQDYSANGKLSAKTIEGVSYSYGNSAATATTYYFYYLRNRWTLSFNTQGGSAIASTPDIMFGEYLTNFAPSGWVAGSTPTKTVNGVVYTFGGWYADANCLGNPFNFSMATMPNRNFMLYAKWLAPSYTATIHLTVDGSNGVVTVQVPVGERLQPTDTPVLTPPAGLTMDAFLGWYWYVDGVFMQYNFNNAVFGDFTLYPSWHTGAYTVTYSPGEGSGTVTDSAQYALGARATVKPATGLTAPAGKVFIGWLGNDNVLYYPNDAMNITGPMTLTAQWGSVAQTTSLTYYKNDGTSDSVTRNQLLNNAQVALEACMFTRQGYEFTGWTLNSPNGTQYQPGQTVRVDTANGNEVYAQWRKVDFNLTIHYVYAEGGTAAPDHTSVVTYTNPYSVTSPIITGFTADQLVVLGTMPAQNVVVTVTYSRNVYTIVYNKGLHGTLAGQDASGNVTHANCPYDSNTPAAPLVTAASGWYFSGWLPVVAAKVTSNQTYVAQYTQQTGITITAKSSTVKYDGGAKSVTGYDLTGTLKAGHRLVVTTSGGAGTDANTYPHTVATYVVYDATNEVVTDQYNITTMPGSLKIDPRTVIMTSRSDSKQYDGTPLMNGNVDVTGDGFVGNQGATYSVTGTQTLVGASDNTFEYTLKANTNASNYTISVQKGVLEVTTNTNTIVITANSANKTYDGSPLADPGFTYTQNVLATGDVLTAVITGSQTNAGTSPNVVTSYVVMRGNDNVTSYYTFGTSQPGELRVAPRTVIMTSRSDSKQYDGTPLTNRNVDVTGDGFITGEGAEYTVTGTQTEKGTSSNTFTFALWQNTNPENYSITKTEGDLIVSGFDARMISITANSAFKTYDGTPLADNGFSVTGLPAQFELRAVITGSQLNFGASSNVVTSYTIWLGNVDVTSNFMGAAQTTNGTLTINKRTVIMTSRSDSKQYDGTPLTNGNVDVTGEGFVGNQGATYSVSGSQTEVGTSDNTFTYSLNADTLAANYNITKTEGTLEVTKDAIPIVITVGSASKKYDGSPLTSDAFTYTGTLATGDVLTVVTAGSQTNAGSSPNVVSSYVVMRGGANVTSNYTFGTSIPGTLTIEKRNVTLTSGSGLKQYDGTPLTNGTVTVGGDDFAGGEGAMYSVIGSQTEVGTSNNTFTYSLNAGTLATNYTITKTEGTLEVTNNTTARITITAGSASKKYDGSPLTSGTYQVTGLPDGFTLTATVAGSALNVGDPGVNTVTGYVIRDNQNEVVTNYFPVATLATGTLTINPRNVTLTSATATKPYDGIALTSPTVTVGGDRFVGVEGATYSNFGSQLYVGHSSNTFSYSLSADTLAANYNITKTEGTLTVSTSTARITITAGSASKKDDGSPLTSSAYQVTGLPDGFTLTATVAGSALNVGDPGVNTVTGYVIRDNQNEVVTNYFPDATLATGTLTINPRNVTLTSATATKPYDGIALTSPTVTVGGDRFVSGQGATYSNFGSQLDVGQSSNTFDYTLNAGTLATNYIITPAPGTLTVSKNTNVIVITAASGTKTYDGTPLTNAGYTYTQNVLATGDVLTAVITGTQTNAGTSPNVVSSYVVMRDGDEVTGNYTFGTHVNGTLTVDQRPITLTANSAVRNYNGTVQSRHWLHDHSGHAG